MKINQNQLNSAILLVALVVVLNLLQGHDTFSIDMIITKLYMLPGIIIGLTLHEFSHAMVSYKLGDPTPKEQGRVTVNPLKHIDPIGFVALIMAGFGWGVPVQINPNYYKNRRLGEALVAVAGVTMNLIIAFVFALILKLMYSSGIAVSTNETLHVIAMILQYGILVNIILMVFNLLPIPPLDGFNFVTQIFRLDKYSWWYQFYSLGTFIFLGLILLNVLDIVINPLIYGLFNAIMGIV